MSMILPIKLEDLLYCRGVESQRVEFKASWNDNHTGPQVLKTICAFANDLHNLNGGYILIGVREANGRAELPPAGLSEDTLESAQKWIRGQCNRLDPQFQPILSPEKVNDRWILAVWVPASDTRPHRAPDKSGKSKYWVRVGPETIDAERKGNLLQQLIEQTAKVPWDDRRAMNARVDDLREAIVREFLRDIESGLLEEPDALQVYRRMRITERVNEHEVPRHIGLLCFSGDPAGWFAGAKIEVVQFAAGEGGDVLEERSFSGPIQDQYRECLNHLQNLSTQHLQKQVDRSQVRGWVSYPLPALREVLVNALYHRSYEVDQREPIKVYLYPDRIEITSYPGPVAGIEPQHLTAEGHPPAVPARNRRIGEIFKELGLAEGRLTGLAKVFRAMHENGSPPPTFRFDSARTYFQATVPAHPEFAALSALRDAAHLRALGEETKAHQRLIETWKANQQSPVLAAASIRSYAEQGDLPGAEMVWEAFQAKAPSQLLPHVANIMIELWLDTHEKSKANELLGRLPLNMQGQDAVDAAILARRSGDQRQAHEYFTQAGDVVQRDPRALHEFAQTKMAIAQDTFHRRRGAWREANRKLLREARQLLERATQLDAPATRHAWVWLDIVKVLTWLRVPRRTIEDAYQKAKSLSPNDHNFEKRLERLRLNIKRIPNAR